ncbi:MAG: hypothetical protein M1272_04135 [Firmicutes bacterium]|nr:hypothetical protein [Bacillota bacterium]
MSTARAHIKEEKRAARHEGKMERKGHPFRNALFISLGVAAVILWQLNPIIRGLHAAESALTQAEGVRRVVGGLISVGYHRVVGLIAPIYHHFAK